MQKAMHRCFVARSGQRGSGFCIRAFAPQLSGFAESHPQLALGYGPRSARQATMSHAAELFLGALRQSINQPTDVC